MNESLREELRKLNYSQWLIEFRPRQAATGGLLTLDVIGDFVGTESIAPNTLWSEVWDFANRKPVIRSGIIHHHCGGVSWHVTEVPWHHEVLVFGVPETPIFKAGMAVWSEFWSMDSLR